MANDYGYFGSGSTGYAHYKQSFDRNFGGSGGKRRESQRWRQWLRLWASVAYHCCCCSRCACAVGNVILNKRRMLPIKKEGHRLRRGGPLFCLLFVRSRGKIMLKVISVKMYSVLLEVQYVYRP